MSQKNDDMSIAKKTEKLNELIAWFESDEFELEKALAMFSQAEKIAAEIEHDLQALKNDIEVVKARFDEL